MAWRVLEAVGDGAYADLALERELKRSKLSPRDRGLATELAYGAIRQRRRLGRLRCRFRRHQKFSTGCSASASDI